jgi:hypothetical protein
MKKHILIAVLLSLALITAVHAKTNPGHAASEIGGGAADKVFQSGTYSFPGTMNASTVCIANDCRAVWPAGASSCPDDQVYVAGTCRTIPDCAGSGDTLNYDQTSDIFSCGSDSYNSAYDSEAEIDAAVANNGYLTAEADTLGSVTARAGCFGCIIGADIADGLGVSEIDETAIQRRVGSTCAAGSSIRQINQDGTVACETDDGITAETDTLASVRGRGGCSNCILDADVSDSLTASYATSAGTATTATIANDLSCSDCIAAAEIGDGLGVGEIDETAIQRRVSSSCAAGASIRVINQDGSVTCQTDAAGDADWTVGGTSGTGLYSAVPGSGVVANGGHAVAMGFNTIASGLRSTAIGYSTKATGDYSIAIGQSINVSGTRSVGIGLNNDANILTQDNTLSIMGGNVGIGTLAPEELLHVPGTIKTGTICLSDCGSGDPAPVKVALGTQQVKIYSGISDSTLTIFGGRRVGINKDLPEAALDIACPTGFTAIIGGTGGLKRKLGCMQTAEEGSATWENANDDCFNTYGGRLPTSSEWFIAAANFALTDETDDYEWVSDQMGSGAEFDVHGTIGGAGASSRARADTTTSPYRCFITH